MAARRHESRGRQHFRLARDPRSIPRVSRTRRRPAYSRAALMLVALLSGVLLGGVQGASCAMHGLGAAQADMMAHMMAGGSMAGHAGMAGHESMTGHESMAGMAHEGGPTSGGEHHGCCSCIGARTMVAPLATAPTAATLLVALVAPEPGRPIE